MNSKRGPSAIVLPIIGAIVAIGAWWALCKGLGIDTFFLPAPPDIVSAFGRSPEYLFTESLTTLQETGIGFLIAVAAGLLMAVLLSSSRVIEQATMPLFVALNAVPKVAVAPLLIVWLGFGQEPKVLMVALLCFFPIIVSTMAGLASTPAELGDLARSLDASGAQTYLKVRMPWALPQMFTGLKVAIALAVVGAVVAEIASPQHGLGAVIVLSGQSLDTATAFAAITLLSVMSVVLFYVIVGIERLLLPWAKEITG
jgi:NitT/TauT family transport system permease protein